MGESHNLARCCLVGCGLVWCWLVWCWLEHGPGRPREPLEQVRRRIRGHKVAAEVRDDGQRDRGAVDGLGAVRGQRQPQPCGPQHFQQVADARSVGDGCRQCLLDEAGRRGWHASVSCGTVSCGTVSCGTVSCGTVSCASVAFWSVALRSDADSHLTDSKGFGAVSNGKWPTCSAALGGGEPRAHRGLAGVLCRAARCD